MLALLLLIAVITVVSNDCSGRCSHVCLNLLVLVRVLLYPRNIIVTKGFKEFRLRHRLAFSYAFKGASHFSFLLLVLAVLLYVFAGVGLRIFGGVITKTGSRGAAIDNSLYGENEYWPLNFNDMPSGMVTMFVLLSINNMHITASGIVAGRCRWRCCRIA
ncbi:hypothetical protein B484DRAFT_255352 [Ochromonadaceae sp. CCMP2298]|nr:hypothetical protein B484DRAFT_255352 [Ochromonadaceae sp. CCMP2298]